MKVYTREQWLGDSELRKWAMKPATWDKRCQCGNEEHWIELIDHESCIIGRIDTVICTKCNEVESFRIIR
jgi:hypothetical protein